MILVNKKKALSYKGKRLLLWMSAHRQGSSAAAFRPDRATAQLPRLRGSAFMAVGPLLAILRLLPRRATAMCASDILFLLGFGFHLAVFAFGTVATTPEFYAVFEYVAKIGHNDRF